MIVLLGSHRDRAASVVLCRSKAQVTAGTGTAVLAGELDLDHLVAVPVHSGRPTDTGVSLRTRRHLVLPVDAEVLCREACPFPCLPLIVRSCRPNKINTKVSLAVDQ